MIIIFFYPILICYGTITFSNTVKETVSHFVLSIYSLISKCFFFGQSYFFTVVNSLSSFFESCLSMLNGYWANMVQYLSNMSTFLLNLNGIFPHISLTIILLIFGAIYGVVSMILKWKKWRSFYRKKPSKFIIPVLIVSVYLIIKFLTMVLGVDLHFDTFSLISILSSPFIALIKKIFSGSFWYCQLDKRLRKWRRGDQHLPKSERERRKEQESKKKSNWSHISYLSFILVYLSEPSRIKKMFVMTLFIFAIRCFLSHFLDMGISELCLFVVILEQYGENLFDGITKTISSFISHLFHDLKVWFMREYMVFNISPRDPSLWRFEELRVDPNDNSLVPEESLLYRVREQTLNSRLSQVLRELLGLRAEREGRIYVGREEAMRWIESERQLLWERGQALLARNHAEMERRIAWEREQALLGLGTPEVRGYLPWNWSQDANAREWEGRTSQTYPSPADNIDPALHNLYSQYLVPPASAVTVPTNPDNIDPALLNLSSSGIIAPTSSDSTTRASGLPSSPSVSPSLDSDCLSQRDNSEETIRRNRFGKRVRDEKDLYPDYIPESSKTHKRRRN